MRFRRWKRKGFLEAPYGARVVYSDRVQHLDLKFVGKDAYGIYQWETVQQVEQGWREFHVDVLPGRTNVVLIVKRDT